MSILGGRDSDWDYDAPSGESAPLTLRCVDCGRAVPFDEADAHHGETGHALAYWGTVQARWARVTPAQKGHA